LLRSVLDCRAALAGTAVECPGFPKRCGAGNWALKTKRDNRKNNQHFYEDRRGADKVRDGLAQNSVITTREGGGCDSGSNV
jgi:hypothetical protein